MKIEIVPHNFDWQQKFEDIKKELQGVLKNLNPTIEHIGSTAVPNLAAKPIIDIALGVQHLSDLDKTIEPMLNSNYLYYEVYNKVMPFRRFFVGLKNRNDIAKFDNIYTAKDLIPHKEILLYKLCHIHVWKLNSSEWMRHIAFRDYLMEHDNIKTKYEILKKQLSLKNWTDGNAYNNGKNNFIKKEEANAILWYKEKRRKNSKTDHS